MRVIVTGAASGIGRATALRLNRDSIARTGEPARIVIADIAPEPLAETERLLTAEGAVVAAEVADLSGTEAPAVVVQRAAAEFGGLDVLISNAGILRASTLLDLSLEDYELTMAINTRATWLLAKAAYPLLKDSRGCIVATASLAAWEPTCNLGMYSASKAALVMLVRQLACDWGPDGIRANTVSPGTTITNIGANSGFAVSASAPRPKGNNPLGFAAEPEDQAAVIAFLASPDARFVTGIDIVADGGTSTQLMQMSGLAKPKAE